MIIEVINVKGKIGIYLYIKINNNIIILKSNNNIYINNNNSN